MSTQVFISRYENEVASLVGQLRNQGYDVVAKSLITIEPVSFDPDLVHSDWIFFSSSNGVRNFFNQKPLITNQKFGAIGKGTAKELLQHASPDFVGDSINTMTTARQFATVIGDVTVLFPGAEKSLGNIQSVFPSENVIELVCYRTRFNPIELVNPDILFFSSPSNVRSFFEMNTIKTQQHVLAFGPSTAKTLKAYGVSVVGIPISLNDEEILNAINRISIS